MLTIMIHCVEIHYKQMKAKVSWLTIGNVLRKNILNHEKVVDFVHIKYRRWKDVGYRNKNLWTRKFVGGLALVLVTAAMMDADVAWSAEGVYLDLSLGGAVANDLNDSQSFKTDFFPGPVFTGSLGYKWRSFRIEGEVYYSLFFVNEVTGDTGGPPPPPSPCLFCSVSDLSGNVDTLAFMINGFYDVELADGFRVYLGGGAGIARVRADYRFNVSVFGLPTDQDIRLVDDSDSVLAYQGMAGLAFDVTPKSEIYIGYRYFATEDLAFSTDLNERFHQDGLRSHVAEIGFRGFF